MGVTGYQRIKDINGRGFRRRSLKGFFIDAVM